MNSVLSGLLTIALPLLGMSLCALGFYALGRWLRSRGHGARLDAIGAVIDKVQHKSGHAMTPLMLGTSRLGRALSALPLFGSKRQRRQWEALQAQAREDSNKHAGH